MADLGFSSVPEKYTFRFDDVCVNADLDHIDAITELLYCKFSGARILHCVSPMVHNGCGERVFPSILNAHSDFRKFYEVDNCRLPPRNPLAERASHGLIHVDHRLLDFAAQEMSILTSCSLAKARVFCPPFNKWNRHTEAICAEHGIELIKFEHGWKCVEYNNFDPSQKLWYLHAREFSFEWFKKWIGG